MNFPPTLWKLPDESLPTWRRDVLVQVGVPHTCGCEQGIFSFLPPGLDSIFQNGGVSWVPGSGWEKAINFPELLSISAPCTAVVKGR